MYSVSVVIYLFIIFDLHIHFPFNTGSSKHNLIVNQKATILRLQSVVITTAYSQTFWLKYYFYHGHDI